VVTVLGGAGQRLVAIRLARLVAISLLLSTRHDARVLEVAAYGAAGRGKDLVGGRALEGRGDVAAGKHLGGGGAIACRCLHAGRYGPEACGPGR